MLSRYWLVYVPHALSSECGLIVSVARPLAGAEVQFALTSITDLIVTTNLLLLSIPCLLHLIYQHAVVDNTSLTLIRVCAIVVLLLVAVALVVLLEVFRFHDRVEVVLLHLNLLCAALLLLVSDTLG